MKAAIPANRSTRTGVTTNHWKSADGFFPRGGLLIALIQPLLRRRRGGFFMLRPKGSGGARRATSRFARERARRRAGPEARLPCPSRRPLHSPRRDRRRRAALHR